MHYRQVTVAMLEEQGPIKVVGKVSHDRFGQWVEKKRTAGWERVAASLLKSPPPCLDSDTPVHPYADPQSSTLPPFQSPPLPLFWFYSLRLCGSA
jgi:hypothetical protein